MVSPRFRSRNARTAGPKIVRLKQGNVTYVRQSPTREVSLNERHARMIAGHQNGVATVPYGEFHHQPIPNEFLPISDKLSRGKSEGERKGNMRTIKTYEGYQSLLADAVLLYRMLKAHDINRLPTVYEMAGLAALRYDIHSPEFSRYLSRMRHLYVVKKIQGMWTSSPNPAMNVAGFIVPKTKKNLVISIEELLANQKETNHYATPIGSREIAEQLGLPLNHQTQIRIGVALNILSAARFVRQQPLAQVETRGLKRGAGQWVHSKYQNARIDSEAKEIQLLRQLFYGSIRGGREPTFIPNEGSSIKKWINRPVTAGDYRMINFLIGIGLVQSEKGEKVGNHYTQQFSLTSSARKAMEVFVKTNHLPESIRRKLMETGRKVRKKRRGGATYSMGEVVKWN